VVVVDTSVVVVAVRCNWGDGGRGDGERGGDEVGEVEGTGDEEGWGAWNVSAREVCDGREEGGMGEVRISTSWTASSLGMLDIMEGKSVWHGQAAATEKAGITLG